VFHDDEGHGRARSWQGGPDNFNRGHERGRRYWTEGGQPDPGPGGPRGFGRGHSRGGRGRFGWIPRDMFGPGRGPRVRRGDVRAAILTLLADVPMHGYQIIQKLGDLSGGLWRLSAGSVYPTLQQLEDEGLVLGQEKDGRNVYALTDEGRKAAEEAAKKPAPWNMAGSEDAASLYGLFLPLGNAVSQVYQVGSPETIAKARAILIDARRSIYRLLAEDDASADSAPAASADSAPAPTADPTQPAE
jgi:DNA-binding PadR family transcriptional regulator